MEQTHRVGRYRSSEMDDDEEDGYAAFLGNIDKIVGSLVMILMMYMVWTFFASPLGSKFGDAMGEFADTAVDILDHWEWLLGGYVFMHAAPWIIDKIIFRIAPTRETLGRCLDVRKWFITGDMTIKKLTDLRAARVELEQNIGKKVASKRPRNMTYKFEQKYLNTYKFNAMGGDANSLSLSKGQRFEAFKEFLATNSIRAEIDENYFDLIDEQNKLSRELEMFEELDIGRKVTSDFSKMSIDEMIMAKRMRAYMKNADFASIGGDFGQGARIKNKITRTYMKRPLFARMKQPSFDSGLDKTLQTNQADIQPSRTRGIGTGFADLLRKVAKAT